jgi:hypothetical protein
VILPAPDRHADRLEAANAVLGGLETPNDSALRLGFMFLMAAPVEL